MKATASKGKQNNSVPPERLSPDRYRELISAASMVSLGAARAIVREAVRGWWVKSVDLAGGQAGQLPLPATCEVCTDLQPSIACDAQAFGRELADLPVAEANAALGRLYCNLLPPSHRDVNGVFYTPPALVRRLLDKAEKVGHCWVTGKMIDPSCGGGAFLVEAAERMVRELADADPSIVLANLSSRVVGWELDPFAGWLAQVSVEAVALPQVVRAGRRLGPVIEERDSLRSAGRSSGAYDLVVGNPPFGKIKDTPEIRRSFGRSLYGHPNFYGLFTDLAVRLARPEGGIVAYLTPASFLAGNYFKRLRKLLQTEAAPVTLDLVESRKDVFQDVLQEVSLATYQRGRVSREAECSLVRVRPSGLMVEATGTLRLPDDPEEPWMVPRSASDAEFVARLQTMPCRLSDWGYTVSTGPLVWNRHKPRLQSERTKGCVPVVWAEAVTQDGRFVLRSATRSHKAWFLPRASDGANLVMKPCVLVQRTTAKEQRRRLISAEMPASLLKKYPAVTVENHLNMVRALTDRPAVPVSAVAAFLATETADRILRCINASVAVSATELEAMPLPRPEELVAALAEDDREAAIRRLYGVEE